MAKLTDGRGNLLAVVPDTLEDWRQAAQVEADIRREFQDKCNRLEAALQEIAKMGPHTAAWSAQTVARVALGVAL